MKYNCSMSFHKTWEIEADNEDEAYNKLVDLVDLQDSCAWNVEINEQLGNNAEPLEPEGLSDILYDQMKDDKIEGKRK
jgi:hypothetical protein